MMKTQEIISLDKSLKPPRYGDSDGKKESLKTKQFFATID